MQLAEKKISANQIIPFFNLPSTKGGSVKTWDYKQRKNLVIYFFSGADCQDCKQTLKSFADRYLEYRRLNTEILAIGTDSIENLTNLSQEINLPYPLLSDLTGEVSAKYTVVDEKTKKPYPSIFITDRYGSLEQQWIVEKEEDLPNHVQILSLLLLFELRCPE